LQRAIQAFATRERRFGGRLVVSEDDLPSESGLEVSSGA